MSDDKNQEIKYEDENRGGEEIDLAEKIKKLKEKLKQCQKERQEYLTGWQRCQADFINYKRRQEEQMGEWSKMFGEGLIKDLLPILDTLDAVDLKKGIRNENNPTQPPLNLRGGEEGLTMVRDQLIKNLQKHGLQEIKSVGEKFNPEFHEAVETVESGSEPGTVVEEVQKGYTLNEKVIRAAKVKVAK